MKTPPTELNPVLRQHDITSILHALTTEPVLKARLTPECFYLLRAALHNSTNVEPDGPTIQLNPEPKELCAEADRRAGAAERKMQDLIDSSIKRSEWLSKAKKEAGYPDEVSFDVVWKETLEKSRKCQKEESKPLSAGELMQGAIHGGRMKRNRVLATFCDPANWVQLYHSEVSPALADRGDYYKPKPCMWGWRGPVLPPYELLNHAEDEPPCSSFCHPEEKCAITEDGKCDIGETGSSSSC